MPNARAIRSLLFCPANRADLIAKLPRAGPDAVGIDLEDGTPLAEKESGRRIAIDGARDLRETAPSLRIFIRTNDPRSPFFADDVDAVASAPIDGLIIPKVERTSDVLDLEASLADAERATGVPSLALVLGIESGLGVLRAVDILTASERACAAYFGGDDFATDIGARRTPGGNEVLYARSHVALAARVARVQPIDQGVFAFRDDRRFVDDAERGRDLGYEGKLCVHPRQVALAHRVFTPTPEEIDWSRRVLEAYRAGLRAGRAAIEVDGVMVDGPLVKRAEAVLALADATVSRDAERDDRA